MGFAGVLSSEAEAYQEACATLGPDAVPALVWLTRHATSAGRLYGAMLLGQHDRDAQRVSLDELGTCDEPVEFAPGGCMVMMVTVSGLARSLRDHGHLDLASLSYVNPVPTPAPSPEPTPAQAEEASSWDRLAETREGLESAWDQLTRGPLVVLIPVVTVGGLVVTMMLLARLLGP